MRNFNRNGKSVRGNHNTEWTARTVPIWYKISLLSKTTIIVPVVVIRKPNKSSACFQHKKQPQNSQQNIYK